MKRGSTEPWVITIEGVDLSDAEWIICSLSFTANQRILVDKGE